VESVKPWWPTTRSNTTETNTIFVKTHKTASSTVSSILHRFCEEHGNVTCFVPHGSGGTMTEPKNTAASLYAYNPRTVNLHTQHTYYWPVFLHKLVPEPAPMITIIRNPTSRFLSTWDYRKFRWRGRRDILNIIQELPLNQSELPADFKRYVDHDSAHVELCPSRPVWAISNVSEPSCVQTLRDMISGKLSLVLLTERLDEGLVLFSRMMGWSLHSVLYWSMKVSGRRSEHDSPSLSTVQKLENWLRLDVLLYQVASDLLDRRIQSQDSSFWSELKQFRQLRLKVETACGQKRYSREFTELDCRHFRQDNAAWVTKEHQRLRDFFVRNLRQRAYKSKVNL